MPNSLTCAAVQLALVINLLNVSRRFAVVIRDIKLKEKHTHSPYLVMDHSNLCFRTASFLYEIL